MTKKTRITKYCKECGTGAIVNSAICTSCGAELKTSDGMQFVSPIKNTDDIEKMKKYLKSKSLRDWALFTLGINSALRISDLLNLKVNDVIDEDGTIRDRIKLREIKTKKTKTFPFSAKVKDALGMYIVSEHPTDALFPSRKGGKAITRQQAHTILSEAAKKIDIKGHISTHSMRKTFAYNAWINEVPITKISEILNHSSEKITRRYLGLTQDSLDEVYLDMDL